jgi:hypothetical protein
MHPERCDVCGRPATVHETAIAAGNVASRHFCDAHGAGVRADAVPLDDTQRQAAITTLAERASKMTPAERARLELEYRLVTRRNC